jgi:hypothetical protein
MGFRKRIRVPARRATMHQFEIIETDQGATVAEITPDLTPEETASRRGAVVIDPGPYGTYEEAYDALMALKLDDEELEEDID